jgi:hypothetical protein
LNVSKCRFGVARVKFLEHEISQDGVSADPGRIAAILQYPPPKNQKQLRQFLGTCTFHNRFIIGYTEYVAPLLPLLKKGVRWKWTSQEQQSFEELRSSFANNLQLVHPTEGKSYELYTDASKVGISAILCQRNDDDKILVISTASRVITAIEQRYSICELELLVIVYVIISEHMI